MKNLELRSDCFFTINEPSTNSIKIKNSQFIGFAFPISTKDEAMIKLRELEKLHYNASHICFAFVLGTDSNVYQYSDAGSPTFGG
ncbi:MAG: YigZ family protein [Bacteroidetes bacterium]|nr:YigZ family protein [Bacteroidota bacterium]